MKFLALIFAAVLLNVSVFAQKQPITVYLAGDSTMAEKKPEKRPETGWGEMFQEYFDAKKVKIDNRAQNGRSTKSFIAEGRWQAIVDNLKKGDYVFIEFGHNDSKSEDPARYAAPDTDYRNNLLRFVSDVRAKNAIPVLLTPVMRRKFDDRGNFVDSHGDYPRVVREVARQHKVALIDMHRTSQQILVKYGAEESKKLFLQLPPGENPNYPNGVIDNTHFNQKGAAEMAALAVSTIKEQKIGLRKYLKKQ